MFSKVKRFLMFLDDLAEVLVFHVFFSKKNWKKSTALLLVMAGMIASMPGKKPAPVRVTMTPELHARAGYEALLKGKHDLAVRELESAVGADPVNALWLQRLGLAYLEANRPESAVRTLSRALTRKASRTTLFYLGCAYQSLKMNDVAIGVFNQVKSSRPTDGLAFESASGYEPVAEAKIGECLIKQGELDRAIASLNSTIARYPNYPHSYFYLGVAQWEKGNPDQGVEQFFKVIELYPQESAAYYNVACYYSIKGVPELALVWLEKALKAGFAQFKHMETDEDLDAIRTLPRYGKLVAKYKKLARAE
jgi:tetratricopeptide (TPR) repeat protein